MAEKVKLMKRMMMRTFEEKPVGDGSFMHTPPQWKAASENLADYGCEATAFAWHAFLEADDVPNNWKFPLQQFNDGFTKYLARAENNSSKPLMEAVWKYRLRLANLFFFHDGFKYGFKDAMTADELKLYEKHRTWLLNSRDDAVKQAKGINWAWAGALERLVERADDWVNRMRN
jgi:hypothetical protein